MTLKAQIACAVAFAQMKSAAFGSHRAKVKSIMHHLHLLFALDLRRGQNSARNASKMN